MGNTQWRPFEENGSWKLEYQKKLLQDIKDVKIDEKDMKIEERDKKFEERDKKSEDRDKNIDEKTPRRILFWGPVKAGKSSVMNSFASIDKNRIAHVAVSVGDDAFAHSITRKLDVIILSNQMKQLHLMDIMGMENGTMDGFHPEDMKFLLDGFLKPGYEFNPSGATAAETAEKEKYFRANPTLAEKAHCNVLVISATDIHTNSLPKPMFDKLKTVCQHSFRAGVPTIILLTKIELVCEQVSKDVTNVYTSEKIQKVVQKAQEMFGINEMNIFPIQNYRKESELKTPMNILLLLALRQMVRYAADFVEISRYRQRLYTDKDVKKGSSSDTCVGTCD